MNTAAATPQSATSQALTGPQVIARLASLDGWKLWGDGDTLAIEKTFCFASYLHTLAFANAVAYVAEQQDHHPDMLLAYRSCSVRWRSHDVAGISQRDVRCAALVDALADREQAGSALG
ncbi:MAG: 4a-hydroxytetrahydrobiopterin dehydratase [Rhodoferax sp.]|nr:4a-hydroxytetrahydrobiopterin dehydratase [Rhodoferax sp.]